MRERLEAIVQGRPGAREASRFWSAVEKELKAVGSRGVTGIKGQFENFERVQPGYYGEMGASIIYQTLYNLFPPGSFNADSIAPLSPDTVLQRVLIPEAALALVMEDMSQDADAAAQTLRASARYGATMF
ncbi:restriction of telomere capping protein 4, partial [Vararia minispora EC-137]